MKNKLKQVLSLLGVLLCFCSCELSDSTDDTPEVVKPKCATLLFYMVGENDLSDYMEVNIANMITGYKQTDSVANILVYKDVDDTPKLYLLNKDDYGTVTLKTVKTYQNQASVDPEVMAEVLNDVFTNYPALKKGVVFSSHADGSLLQTSTIGKRSFGMEKINGTYYGMNITDINEALSKCAYLDMVMFDACLMANIETAYEIKDRAKYLLATPNSVPGNGFPYQYVISDLLKMDKASLEHAAEQYYNYYRMNSVEWDDFVAVSLTDLTKISSVAEAMDSLCRIPCVRNKIEMLEAEDIQKYELTKDLYDCGQWIDSIGCGSKQATVVKAALDAAVVYKKRSDYACCDDWGTLYLPITDERFSGLNTYLPGDANTMYEILQQQFFTTLKWYTDAGLWRCSRYNRYAVN